MVELIGHLVQVTSLLADVANVLGKNVSDGAGLR
jgi:hypothetical protein